MGLNEWVGKIVTFRSIWPGSGKMFYGIVESVTTPTPDAHRNYAFVRSVGNPKARPVHIARLQRVLRSTARWTEYA